MQHIAHVMPTTASIAFERARAHDWGRCPPAPINLRSVYYTYTLFIFKLYTHYYYMLYDCVARSRPSATNPARTDIAVMRRTAKPNHTNGDKIIITNIDFAGSRVTNRQSRRSPILTDISLFLASVAVRYHTLENSLTEMRLVVLLL